MKLLKDNGISKIEIDGLWIYKTQPLFMTDNEIYCLKMLYSSGYVPYAELVSKETIRLRYIHKMPVTNFDVLQWSFAKILKALEDTGIRHGDLTDVNILVRDNHPYVIDFSESRLVSDPRPDKRREGDEYWLRYTFEKMKREHGLL